MHNVFRVKFLFHSFTSTADSSLLALRSSAAIEPAWVLEYLIINEQDTGAYTDNCVMVAVAAIKADILRFGLAESPGVSAAN
jgi:hypothetical protein